MHGRSPHGAPTLEALELRLVPASLPGAEVIPGAESLTPALVRRDTPGVYDPTTGLWYLRSSATSGVPDDGKFLFGGAGYAPVVGDWDGDGLSGIGAVADGRWFLRQSATPGDPSVSPFDYGLAGWTPLAGDWLGTGHDGIGVFDPGSGTWYLNSEAESGPADVGIFQYGLANWEPVVGDWDGDGTTDIGVFDPTTGTFHLRHTPTSGPADVVFQFGQPGWKPLAGDWDGDGRSEVALVDPEGTWHLRPEVSTGGELTFGYGLGGWQPVAGTWAPVRPLLAQGRAAALGVPALTQRQLDTIVTAAYARLNVDELPDDARREVYASRFVVSDLGPRALAVTDRATRVIHVSADGAGRGWFIDATPMNDGEFTPQGKGKGWTAASRTDLLSVVLHEIAGLTGERGDLRGGNTLAAGTRLIP